VPDGCAVVGCDDIDVAAYTAPPLTTVRVPFTEVGEQAMSALLDTIEGAPPPAERAPLDVRLVVRQSS
jgi:LacI family transcriptional regulator